MKNLSCQIEVSLERAVELCCAQAHPLNTESIVLEAALNRVAALEVPSPIQVPTFSRSQMDGFTLTGSDLLRLGAGACLELQVAATVPAGWQETVRFFPGQTVSIMTGAMIPGNTAAIVKQEDVENKGDYIKLSGSPVQGQYIDPPGCEIEAGETIIGTGQEINPGSIERLAAAGLTRVTVYTIPRVYIIGCGSELCLPGKVLPEGKIYHSHRHYMLAKVQTENCKGILGEGEVVDDLGLITEEIRKGLGEGDLLIISGGTAQGKYDLVADALRQLGADFLFRSIASKPGRNVSCSSLEGCLVFNLPGRPSAGGIMFDLLLAPVLRKIRGSTDCGQRWLKLRLSENIVGKGELRSFRRGELVADEPALLARPLAKHESGRGKIPLLLDIEPGRSKKGDIVRALLLNRETWDWI